MLRAQLKSVSVNLKCPQTSLFSDFLQQGSGAPVQTQSKQTLVELTKNEEEGCWSVKSTTVPKA